MPKPGFVKRQIENTTKEIRDWPEWMRREAGFAEGTSMKDRPKPDRSAAKEKKGQT